MNVLPFFVRSSPHLSTSFDVLFIFTSSGGRAPKGKFGVYLENTWRVSEEMFTQFLHLPI